MSDLKSEKHRTCDGDASTLKNGVFPKAVAVEALEGCKTSVNGNSHVACADCDKTDFHHSVVPPLSFLGKEASV